MTTASATTMLAARLERPGGAEALRVGPVPRPEPRSGQLLIRVSRSAVNFSDERSCRTGMNHFTGSVQDPPTIPGGEVVGRRTDTGERVAAVCRTGGYAQYVAVDESLVFGLPNGVDDETALGVFVPGLTAALMLDVAGDPGPGTVAAVFGATGAVGSLLLQLLRARGTAARIAAVSGPAAEAAARRHGATAVVGTDPERLGEALRSAAGRALDVVFDPVAGRATQAAVDAVGRGGRVIVYGSASGEPGAVDPRSLIMGSRTVVGFWLMDHLAEHDRARAVFDELLGGVARGRLSVAPPLVFALPDVRAAMRAVAERGAGGRVLLDPWTG